MHKRPSSESEKRSSKRGKFDSASEQAAPLFCDLKHSLQPVPEVGLPFSLWIFVRVCGPRFTASSVSQEGTSFALGRAPNVPELPVVPAELTRGIEMVKQRCLRIEVRVDLVEPTDAALLAIEAPLIAVFRDYLPRLNVLRRVKYGPMRIARTTLAYWCLRVYVSWLNRVTPALEARHKGLVAAARHCRDQCYRFEAYCKVHGLAL